MVGQKVLPTIFFIIFLIIALPLLVFKDNLFYEPKSNLQTSAEKLYYFEWSIISGLSIMMPLILDSDFGELSGPEFRSTDVVLNLGNILPLLVLLCQYLKPEVLFVLCHLRYLFGSFICFNQVDSLGHSMFHHWHMIGLSNASNLTIAFFTWTTFSSSSLRDILAVFVWIGFIAEILILSCFLFLWLRHMSNQPINQLSIDGRKCRAYLISMEFVQIAFVIMLFIYGPCINEVDMPSYVATCNYISTVSALLAWLLCGRIMRLDLKQKKVCSSIIKQY